MRRATIAIVLSAVTLLIPMLAAHQAPKPCLGDVFKAPARWQKAIENHLTPAKALQSATKEEFLAALAAAIAASPNDAPQLATAAAIARPQLARQIIEVSFHACEACEIRAKILCGVSEADPKEASQLFDRGVQLAPDCPEISRDKSQSPSTNTGNYGNPPGLNGQNGLVAICHNGQTIFLTPKQAEQDLRRNPGDTAGACQVTPANNR